MIYADSLIEMAKFLGKLLMVIATTPMWQAICQKLIERWSEKKKSHIELAAQEFDKRIAVLEQITQDHSKRMDQNEVSNKMLTAELASCRTQLLETSSEIGSVSTDFKKNIELMSVSIIERLEKDEGTILV